MAYDLKRNLGLRPVNRPSVGYQTGWSSRTQRSQLRFAVILFVIARRPASASLEGGLLIAPAEVSPLSCAEKPRSYTVPGIPSVKYTVYLFNLVQLRLVNPEPQSRFGSSAHLLRKAFDLWPYLFLAVSILGFAYRLWT